VDTGSRQKMRQIKTLEHFPDLIEAGNALAWQWHISCRIIISTAGRVYPEICGIDRGVPDPPLFNWKGEGLGDWITSVNKLPNPIDRHVGSRVRMRRAMLSMSQEKLGEALGLTFQQIQKYEKGTNRISASRLQQISQILEVPPSYFFEGAPSFETQSQNEAEGGGFSEDSHAVYNAGFLTTPEAIQLILAFARIKNPKVRSRIVELVTALAGEDDQPSALIHLNSPDQE